MTTHTYQEGYQNGVKDGRLAGFRALLQPLHDAVERMPFGAARDQLRAVERDLLALAESEMGTRADERADGD